MMPDPNPVEVIGGLPEPEQSTPAPVAPEPKPDDLSALLQRLDTDDTLRQRLLDHAKVKREIEHRVKSTRQADIDREVNARLAAIKAQQESEAERAKIMEMDPYELGEKVKKDAKAGDEAKAALAQGLAEVGRTIYSMVQSNPDLTNEERHELHPSNPKYTSFASYWDAVIDAIGLKRAKELAKELAKVDAEALYNERLAKEREGGRSPVSLPVGTNTSSDAQFLEDFASGKSDDFARYAKLRAAVQ